MFQISNVCKIVIIASFFGSLFMLTGCAAPSRSCNMMVAKSDLSPNLPKKSCCFTNNVCVGEVEGGSETHPLGRSLVDNGAFKNALEKSLVNVDLYHDNPKARYILNAKLEKLKQPLIGFDFTVTCQTKYQIFDQQKNKIVFERTLTTPYTASFTSSIIGIERMKVANEGAVRENIRNLINQLYSIQRS